MDDKYLVRLLFGDSTIKEWEYDTLTEAEAKYHNVIRYDEDVTEVQLIWGNTLIEVASF